MQAITKAFPRVGAHHRRSQQERHVFAYICGKKSKRHVVHIMKAKSKFLDVRKGPEHANRRQTDGRHCNDPQHARQEERGEGARGRGGRGGRRDQAPRRGGTKGIDARMLPGGCLGRTRGRAVFVPVCPAPYALCVFEPNLFHLSPEGLRFLFGGQVFCRSFRFPLVRCMCGRKGKNVRTIPIFQEKPEHRVRVDGGSKRELIVRV
mmetsp:Transcript_42184/g.108641  ORF Transcript_42184/g.108641 Transcript_42184/m.108641 type:complete len:206 (+) Transcript_42184:2893-3510(+)